MPLRNSWGSESNASSTTLTNCLRFILHRLAQPEAWSSWFFDASSGYKHGANLEPVQPGPHRWVAFAEPLGLLLAIDFQHGEAESPASCHHRAEEKNCASGKVLLKVASMRIDHWPSGQKMSSFTSSMPSPSWRVLSKSIWEGLWCWQHINGFFYQARVNDSS